MSQKEFPINQAFFQKIVGEDLNITNHFKDLSDLFARTDLLFEPLADPGASSRAYQEILTNNYFLPDVTILKKALSSQPDLLTNTALILEDDLEQIYAMLKTCSGYRQHGIHVCVDFSRLRASRPVPSQHKQSVGPIKFMELFAHAPQQKNTNCPLTFFLNLDHENIEDFIEYVQTQPKHINFLLGVPQHFLWSLLKKKPFALKYQQQAESSLQTDSIKLFHKLINLILKGHPVDLIFSDNLSALKQSTTGAPHTINAHYQVSSPHEFMACGLLNLAPFVTPQGLDKTKLQQIIPVIVQLLDNCFEINLYPDTLSRETTEKSRRLGVSFSGLHTLLAQLNPEKGSHKTQQIISDTFHFLNKQFFNASHRLGAQRGFKTTLACEGSNTKTRHTQLLAQIHQPELNNLMQTTPYLFPHQATLQDCLALYDTHMLWQHTSSNLVSFKHPIPKNTNLDLLVKAFFTAHEKKLMSFETISLS